MRSWTCLICYQIEEYYAAKGLNIVGYFHANERFDDYEVGGVAKNIGDHISRFFPHAALLLVRIVLLCFICTVLFCIFRFV